MSSPHEQYSEVLDTLLSPLPEASGHYMRDRTRQLAAEVQRLQPYEIGPDNLDGVLDELGARFVERVPIIDADTMRQYRRQKIANKWRLVAGAALRDIQKDDYDPTATQQLLTEPVNDATAGRLTTAMQHSPLTARALGLHPAVHTFVNLPEVPDDMLGDAPNKFQRLVQPSEVIIDMGWSAIGGPEESLVRTRDELREYQRAGAFGAGILDSENYLAYARYPMARDSVLLAVGAELRTNPDLRPDAQNRILLPSGTVLAVVPGQEDQAAALLDVRQWRGRFNIQDRVYRVATTSGDFILKEHKTNRHLKVLPGTTPNSSAEEVAIGTELALRTSARDELASVSWERPIGYVEAPNGFGAAVFAFEENLVPADKAHEAIAQAIRQHPQPYRAEYEAITAIAGNEAMAWDDYINAKARMLHSYASDLLIRDTHDAGFINNDPKLSVVDHQLRIHIPEDDAAEIHLEAVGFDYEYFKRASTDASTKDKKRFNERFVTGRVENLLDGICGGYASDEVEHAIGQITAYRLGADLPVAVKPFVSL